MWDVHLDTLLHSALLGTSRTWVGWSPRVAGRLTPACQTNKIHVHHDSEKLGSILYYLDNSSPCEKHFPLLLLAVSVKVISYSPTRSCSSQQWASYLWGCSGRFWLVCTLPSPSSTQNCSLMLPFLIDRILETTGGNLEALSIYVTFFTLLFSLLWIISYIQERVER